MDKRSKYKPIPPHLLPNAPAVANPDGRGYHLKKIVKEYQEVVSKSVSEIMEPKIKMGWIVLGYYMQHGTAQQRVDIAKHVTRITAPDARTPGVDARTLIQMYVNVYNNEHNAHNVDKLPMDESKQVT
jgi:hypothetical protein